MDESIHKVARLLRTPDKIVADLQHKMRLVTGKKGVIEKIAAQNNKRINQALENLALKKSEANAKEVYEALLEKTEDTDKLFADHFKISGNITESGYKALTDGIKGVMGELRGFYLKEEKARELMRLNPPRSIMKSLGYEEIDEMLKKEDIFEIFCALRFVENSDWLNEVFFKPYKDLKWSDFEERAIRITALPERWKEVGKEFLGKKLHHMSHLKEMGIAFIIPVSHRVPGEVLYLFFMILHYVFEIDWHARLFKTFSKDKDFADKMINALKVGVTEMPLPKGNKEISWRVVPKYLAKHNVDDPRLFEPHVSPEAWHYARASKVIRNFASRHSDLGLDFWEGLGVAGEYFPDGSVPEVLISFDLFDNGISLLRQAGFESKYLYHQQEALWNHVFTQYMGEDTLDEMMMQHLTRGYFTLKIMK